ncbi:hypothetical protein FQA39_LY13229 [Lamprigera yunnana]|nr:hypothetical protein FQA39_LY13229 [Lamprigera yunnana]
MHLHITIDLKARIVAELESGQSVREISQLLNVSRFTVGRVRIKLTIEHTIARAVGSGRRRISTPTDDEELVAYKYEDWKQKQESNHDQAVVTEFEEAAQVDENIPKKVIEQQQSSEVLYDDATNMPSTSKDILNVPYMPSTTKDILADLKNTSFEHLRLL